MSRRRRSRRLRNNGEKEIIRPKQNHDRAQSVPVTVGKQMFTDLIAAVKKGDSDAIENLHAFGEEIRQYVHTLTPQEDDQLRKELKDKYEFIILFLATPAPSPAYSY